MQCKDCGKEVTEEQATTYMRLDKYCMIEEYKSILCPECREKQLEKIDLKCAKCGREHTFLFKLTPELQKFKDVGATISFGRKCYCGESLTKRLP